LTAARRPLSAAATVFWVSVLGLFAELALIRWVSCEVRVFAYLKNLVLVASFLGFGAGCFASRRRIDLARPVLLLALLGLVVRLPWPLLAVYGPRQVSTVLARLPGLMIFQHYDPAQAWHSLGGIVFALAWTVGLFLAVALVMMPFGQTIARAMVRLPRPLTAYSWNVAGSLTGILLYTGACAAGTAPVVWFGLVALACAILAARRERVLALGLSLLVVLAFMPSDSAVYPEFWTSYQKLELRPGGFIMVNNVGFQTMMSLPALPAAPPYDLSRYTMPYVLRRPPGRVLIVGAGSGTDVAGALAAGAASVTAVEIDQTIYRIGRALHPQRPYQDPRVRVVIDDARHFLRTTREQFDLIVFSHLDSHTLLSSYTNVRLDNYIYTEEAFAEARSRLSPHGLLYVSYLVELPFVADRLGNNLERAFGHPPVSYAMLADDGQPTEGFQDVNFLTGSPAITEQARAAVSHWGPVRTFVPDPRVPRSTDAWPFLHLARHQVPAIMLLVSAVILLLATAFALWARPRGEPFDGRLFWLGAAFMLVEVHNVSRLALVFGTTWQVNAWAIGAILLVILAANGVCTLGRAVPPRVAAAGLFATLAVAWLMPLEAVVRLGAAGNVLVTLVMTAPIFFAGLLFADSFSQSASPGFALGWNVLGSVVGGMSENLSFLVGIPALLLVAAAFYALALLARRPGALPAAG
jgi:SAM-dependent methyltransferase